MTTSIDIRFDVLETLQSLERPATVGLKGVRCRDFSPWNLVQDGSGRLRSRYRAIGRLSWDLEFQVGVLDLSA